MRKRASPLRIRANADSTSSSDAVSTTGRMPAFQPMMPGLGPTVGALLITIAMALIGGTAARWLAGSLARFERTQATV